MTELEEGLLHVSGSAAVLEQQAFGRSEQLPWGVSESAYFAQDHTLAYQYSPFGVPRLALRRTPVLDRCRSLCKCDGKYVYAATGRFKLEKHRTSWCSWEIWFHGCSGLHRIKAGRYTDFQFGKYIYGAPSRHVLGRAMQRIV